MSTEKTTLLSAEVRAEIDRWVAKYPPERKRSAVLSALTTVQEVNGGWLTNELMDAVAAYLDMPTIAVYEVATFYSMFDLKETGRHKISLKREEECLAACCGAPMMAVDGHYHENLTPAKVDAILDGLE
jgi:NADH-quinone oxidoreductase subunit E